MFLPQELSGKYFKLYIGLWAADQSAVIESVQNLYEACKEEADAQDVMGITEHQLFSGAEDPVTAACFDVDVPVEGAATVRSLAEKMTEEQPGACICIVPVPMENPEDGLHEDIATHAAMGRHSEIKKQYMDMIRFGQKLKRETGSDDDLANVLKTYDDVSVFGNEAGAAYAIAAIGLRFGGDDGQFVGTYDMTGFSARAFGSVALCIGGFRGQYGIDPKFADRVGSSLGFHERIILVENAKAVLDNGCFTLLCTLGNDDMWRPYTPDDFGKTKKNSCDYFELDPDCVERFQETRRRACSTCLFRKLTDEGFVCTVGHEPVR